MEPVWARRTYHVRSPGLVRGRLHSTIMRAMNPSSGGDLMGHGAARILDFDPGGAERNHLAGFTLHGFSFSPWSLTGQGHLKRADTPGVETDESTA